MQFNKTDLQKMADSVPWWFHSIDLGEGIVTKGYRPAEQLSAELSDLRMPDLRGKSVLDIGAWDGFFSFEAERQGAARVLALDQFAWTWDIDSVNRYWDECRQKGVTPKPPQTFPELWRPTELPGKRGFDLARNVLNSNVESLVSDFMEMDLDKLGIFDVVLYLGVLYHMQNPFHALQRVASVTGQVAIIETEALTFPEWDKYAICQFFKSDELNHDFTNWWVPNEKALIEMCLAAGFGRVDILVSPPRYMRTGIKARLLRKYQPKHYRAIVHAWK